MTHQIKYGKPLAATWKSLSYVCAVYIRTWADNASCIYLSRRCSNFNQTGYEII